MKLEDVVFPTFRENVGNTLRQKVVTCLKCKRKFKGTLGTRICSNCKRHKLGKVPTF